VKSVLKRTGRAGAVDRSRQGSHTDRGRPVPSSRR
jgi:hypothetical protein